MSVLPVRGPGLRRIAPLFFGWEETAVSLVLRGACGCAGRSADGSSAWVGAADFAFLSGAPDPEIALAAVENRPFRILVPRTQDWDRSILQVFGKQARPVSRYATRKNLHDLSRPHLLSLCEIPDGFVLRRPDRELLDRLGRETWSKDFCSSFATPELFFRDGRAVIALDGTTPVSGASSYLGGPGMIEIEVDTRADYRRRGLARACCARLILSCLEDGIYPSWDAQNTASLALARQLGYRPAGEYSAYEITNEVTE